MTYRRQSERREATNNRGFDHNDVQFVDHDGQLNDLTAKHDTSKQALDRKTSSLSMMVTFEDRDTGKNKMTGSPTPSDYSKLFSGLYALLLILLGFLFPLSEAVPKPKPLAAAADTLDNMWLRTIYNTVFLVYIYTIGTACLIYLQLFLLRTDHDHPDHPSTDKPKSSLHASMVKQTSQGLLITDADAPPHKETKKARRKVSSKRMSASAVVRYNSASNLASKDAEADFAKDNDVHHTGWNHSNGRAGSNGFATQISTDSDQFGEKVDEEFEVFIDVSKLGNIFSHDGSSFFLRLGALIFGIGHIIYLILEIQANANTKEGCQHSPYWWTYIIRLVFIVVQTFVIFKNQAVHIRADKEPHARYTFMHLIAANLCVWIRTLINEVLIERSHYNGGSYCSANATHHFAAWNNNPIPIHHRISLLADVSKCSTALDQSIKYLFPFVLEYSLIAMGMIAVMYWSIDEDKKDKIEKGLANLFKVDVFVNDQISGASHGGGHGGHDETMFSKSHRGIFLGFLLFAATIISIVLFFYESDNEADLEKVKNSEMIYLISDIIMRFCLLVAAIIAVVKLNPLSYVDKPGSIDDALLLVATSGSMLFEFSIIMASSYALSKRGTEAVEVLRLCSGLMAAVQTIVQVVLILNGLRRYPSKQTHVSLMPGRGALTFLVIGNITVWIFRSMQAKELELQCTQLEFFGTLTWLLLMNISLPLLLFYHFHASICLADVWHVAYIPLHSKVENPTTEHSHGTSIQESQSMGAAMDGVNPLIRSVSVPHFPQLTRSMSASKFMDFDEESDYFKHGDVDESELHM